MEAPGRPRQGPYRLRHLPGRQCIASCTHLLELQPELLEAIAGHLDLRDLATLATTCHTATPLHATVIGTRIAALRQLTDGSHGELVALIDRLPNCPARVEVASVIESSMHTFRSVCTCNEDFLRLSRAVAMRGLAGAPFTSPVDAARLARSCCQTCDDVTRALRAVSSWLLELTELVSRSGAAGERALIESSEAHQQNAAGPPDGEEEAEAEDDDGENEPLEVDESSEQSGEDDADVVQSE